MTRVLLVTLEVDPTEDMDLLAEEVHDILESSSFPVIQVKAWNQPGSGLSSTHDTPSFSMIPPPDGFLAPN